jgi:hypothetical protein
MASPEQLMFTSDGVLSQARNSAATYHSNAVIGEQKLAIAPEPPKTAAGGPRPRRGGGLDMMNNYMSNDAHSNYNYKIPRNDGIDMGMLEKQKGQQKQKRRNVMTKSLNPMDRQVQ